MRDSTAEPEALPCICPEAFASAEPFPEPFVEPEELFVLPEPDAFTSTPAEVLPDVELPLPETVVSMAALAPVVTVVAANAGTASANVSAPMATEEIRRVFMNAELQSK